MDMCEASKAILPALQIQKLQIVRNWPIDRNHIILFSSKLK